MKNLERAVRVYCALAESPVKVDSSSVRSWAHIERALTHSPNLLMEMRGLEKTARGRVLSYVGEFAPLVESRPVFQLPDDIAAKRFVKEVEEAGGMAAHLDNGGLVSASSHDFKTVESIATRLGGAPYKGPRLADAFESVDTTLPEAMIIKGGVDSRTCEKALIEAIYLNRDATTLSEANLFAGFKVDGVLDRWKGRISSFCRPKSVLGVSRRLAEAVRVSGLATPEMIRLMEAGEPAPGVSHGGGGAGNDNRGGLTKEQPGNGSPANSRSGQQKSQTLPTEHVPAQEQGATGNAVRLPDGTVIPMDTLRQAFGKMLHNMATQVEQGTVGGTPTPRGADQMDAAGAKPPPGSMEQQQAAMQSQSQRDAGNGAEPPHQPAVAIYTGGSPAPGQMALPPVGAPPPVQGQVPGQLPPAPVPGGPAPPAVPPPPAPPHPAPGPDGAAAPAPGAPPAAPGAAPPHAPPAPGAAPPHPGAPAAPPAPHAAPGQPPAAPAPGGDVEGTLAKAEAGDAEALKQAQGMQGQMTPEQKARLQALVGGGKPAGAKTDAAPPPPPAKKERARGSNVPSLTEGTTVVRRALNLLDGTERDVRAGLALIEQHGLEGQPGMLVERVRDKLQVLTMHASPEVQETSRAALGRGNDKPATQDPAWEPTIKAMKKHKEIDNPFALANWMKNQGDEPHKGKGGCGGQGCYGFGRMREGVGFEVWEPIAASPAGVLPEGLNYGAGALSPGTQVMIIERGDRTIIVKLPNGDTVRTGAEHVKESTDGGFVGDQFVKLLTLEAMMETFRGSGVSQVVTVVGAPTSGRGYFIRTKIAPWIKRVQERVADSPFPSLVAATGEAARRNAVVEMRRTTAREDHSTLALAKNEAEFDKMLLVDPRFRHVAEGRGVMLRDTIDWRTFQPTRASFDRFFGAPSVRRYYDGMGESRDRLAEAVVERMVRERRVPAFVQIGKVLVVDATPGTPVIEVAAAAKANGMGVTLVEMRLDLDTVLRRAKAAKLREAVVIKGYNAVRKTVDEARRSHHIGRVVTYSWRGGASVFEGRFIGEDGSMPGKGDTVAVVTKKNIDGEDGEVKPKSMAVTSESLDEAFKLIEGDPFAPKLREPHNPDLIPVKVKGIGMLLASLGFEAASKDVTADNYMRYAQWVLGSLKSRINLTNPITREKIIDTHAQATYDKAKRAFKAMGLSEAMLGEALDVGQRSEAESCASGMKEAGEQLKAAREAVFKLTTSTLVQCASMAQATGAKRTQKELAKAQVQAATFLDDLQALAAQVDRANETMKGENGGMGGDNLEAMKALAAANPAAVPPATPPATPAAPAPKVESADQAIRALAETDIPDRIVRGEDYRSLNESISSRCPRLSARQRIEVIERFKALANVPNDPTMRIQFGATDHRLLTEAATFGSRVSALVERTRNGGMTLASEAEVRSAIEGLRKKGKAGHLMLADVLEGAITDAAGRSVAGTITA